MAEFSGLVAIVTGGASGIGAATVTLLRARGATAVSLDISGGDVMCDVSDTAQVAAAVAEVIARHGALDIVVNNAGIGASGTIEDPDLDEWRRLFEVNVLGAVRMSNAALPWLTASPHASIVNTASVAADTGLVMRAAYSASKGAITSLTRAMAADFIPLGIRVNAVAPGTAATPWVARLLDESDDPELALQKLTARQPIGRLITAEEIAYGIAYLASPLSASTTGTVLPIDGGLHSLR